MKFADAVVESIKKELKHKQKVINEYLRSVLLGDGWVSLNKIVEQDLVFDEELSSANISLDEIVSEALSSGFILRICEDEWAICVKGISVRESLEE